MKIAVITCYFDPDYVRSLSLRAALRALPGVEVIVVKNTHRGLLRYPEILWQVWRVKHSVRPDVYLLGFRGQEILPFILLLAGKKPVWFDEFLVPLAWANQEKHALTPTIVIQKTLARLLARPIRCWPARHRQWLAYHRLPRQFSRIVIMP